MESAIRMLCDRRMPTEVKKYVFYRKVIKTGKTVRTKSLLS